ncbi:lysozyme inhibitor LprI family protein [Primorskyibacter sp. S87]|uniref:lysozyme inhibitor LprI family protein n=1 Tax=Primorskyibacter sp. S87 TaxID=3415126 RepID=UPI003C7AF4BC
MRLSRQSLSLFCAGFLFLPAQLDADPSLECSGAGSQVEIGDCVAGMEAQVETALGIAYEIALSSAEELDQTTGRETARPALEQAQTAWSAYRDAQCEAVGASFGGGSGTGIGIRSCRVELGRIRVDALLGMGR